MHKPLRHIEDTVTSVVALLISAALGYFGVVVLVLMLALGFRVPLVNSRKGHESESPLRAIQI